MGIAFAYESKACRDKEKRRSRAKRALVGRLDERTGGIVPVDGRAKSARKRAAGGERLLESGGACGGLREKARLARLENGAIDARNA